VGTEVEEAVVGLRKELTDLGLDAGAATIRWHLGRRRVRPLPSEATIWRILVRRGFVMPQPHKRPKASFCRFEAAFPNELWQIDAMDWVLADLTPVETINILDDHSRLAAAGVAVPSTTGEGAWEAFSGAAAEFGLPVRCLSDNGLAFSGKLRGFEVYFEARLREAGITPVTSHPYHPQTCGKVERFQQTLKRFLRAQGPFHGIEDVQAALDRFRAYYNHERPHRGIGRVTPHERWSATPRVASPGVPLPAPAHRTRALVDEHGIVQTRRFAIAVGVDYARLPADVFFEAGYANVFVDGQLVRHVELDPTRRYQPSGRRRGGPKRPRRLA